MPVSYRFDSKIVVIEMVGEYSMDDIRQTILNSLADPGRPIDSYLMINLTESQSIYERTSVEVKTMAKFVATLGGQFNNRIALVASKDFPFGMLRMSSVGSEERGIETEVFRTLSEAREWLLS